MCIKSCAYAIPVLKIWNPLSERAELRKCPQMCLHTGNSSHGDSLRRLAELGILTCLLIGLTLLVFGPQWMAPLEERLVERLLSNPKLRASVTRPRQKNSLEAAYSSSITLPLGTVLAYAGEPNVKNLFEQGFMLCNGQRLVANSLGWSREEFDALFQAMGAAWGGRNTPRRTSFPPPPRPEGHLPSRGRRTGRERSRRNPQGARRKEPPASILSRRKLGGPGGELPERHRRKPQGIHPARQGPLLRLHCRPLPQGFLPPLSLYARAGFRTRRTRSGSARPGARGRHPPQERRSALDRKSEVRVRVGGMAPTCEDR
jgi:hypothetical protein